MTATTTHAAARRLLSARLDAPLTSAEADALAAHLAGCRSCRAFEQRLATGMLGLTTLPRVPGNPAVARAVRAGLQSDPRAGWLRNGLKLAGALVAFGLVGVVLVTVLRPSNSAPQLQPGAAVGSPTARPAATASTTRDHVVVPQTPSASPDVPSPAPSVCDPNVLEFTSSVGAAAGSRGITIMAAIPVGQTSPQPTNTAPGGQPCHLATTVTLTLVDASGAPLDIDGNGAQGTLEGDLPAGPAEATFLWSNWCGTTDGIYGLATIGDALRINVPLDEPPPCNGPNQPSWLAPIAPPDPTATPAPSATEPVACDITRLDLSPNITITSDGVELGFSVSKVADGITCRLQAEISLTVFNGDQQPLDITGNGALLPLDMGISGLPKDSIPPTAALLWSNWCGADTPDHVSVLINGAQRLWFEIADQPACDAANQPSTFTPITKSIGSPVP